MTAGLHDVTASALGIGGYGEGVLAVVAGTYSINETVSAEPKVDPRWFCRNGLRLGEWNNMAISPASAANYDWFLDTLCAGERRAAEADGASIHAAVAAEIETALARPCTLSFPPLPLRLAARGRGQRRLFRAARLAHPRRHAARGDRGHRLQPPRPCRRPARRLRASRGAADGRHLPQPGFAQVFADVLGLAVTVTEMEEAAAWGAALCAGAGVGLFASPRHDPRDLAALGRCYHPDPARSADAAKRYRLHCDIAAALGPVWPSIEALAPERG